MLQIGNRNQILIVAIVVGCIICVFWNGISLKNLLYLNAIAENFVHLPFNVGTCRKYRTRYTCLILQPCQFWQIWIFAIWNCTEQWWHRSRRFCFPFRCLLRFYERLVLVSWNGSRLIVWKCFACLTAFPWCPVCASSGIFFVLYFSVSPHFACQPVLSVFRNRTTLINCIVRDKAIKLVLV